MYGAGQIVTVHVAVVAYLCDGEPLGAACCTRAITDRLHSRLSVLSLQSKVSGQMEVGKECCVYSHTAVYVILLTSRFNQSPVQCLHSLRLKS